MAMTPIDPSEGDGDAAAACALRIWRDAADRQGIDHALDGVSESVRDDILGEWAEIVRAFLRKADGSSFRAGYQAGLRENNQPTKDEPDDR